VLVIGVVLALGWRSFGERASGERRARMERSPQWKDGHFVNPQPIINLYWEMIKASFGGSSNDVSPSAPIAVSPVALDVPPASGLRVTWLGHSTTIIEIDGIRILTDANWSERASPFQWIGPRRWFPPIIALASLPKIDVVLISHDHYDHLDMATIEAMKGWDARFVVPLGVGALLEGWDVPAAKIAELDWWEKVAIAGVEIVATPARHATGRFAAQDRNLWASYAIIGPAHRVYYSGDTGLFPALTEIGARLGPFDVTMFEIGQYHRTWPDWHLGPEQAVQAHKMIGGKVLFPIHWALFPLAFHGWTEPIERVLAEAKKQDVIIVAPKPGESVEPSAPPAIDRWWPDLPWETAEQHPIISSQMN